MFKKLTIENPKELENTFKNHFTEWEIEYAAESSSEYGFYLKNPKQAIPFIIVSMPKVTTPMYNPYTFTPTQAVKIILSPKNPTNAPLGKPVTKNMELHEFRDSKKVLRMLIDALPEMYR